MKNTKRFMALLLALVLVFSSMTTAFANDVNEDVMDTTYEAAVRKLSAVGIMQGYPDGTFRAENEITRAEFAKIAVAALGLGDAAEISAANTIFTDVNASHWAAGFINLAVDRGVIVGYPDGTFRPEGKITNAEAITILVRLIGLAPVVDKEGTWPANYVSRANNEGILKDVPVASNANAIRGNAAKMLANTILLNKWGADGYNNDGTVSYGRLGMSLLTDNLNIRAFDDARIRDYDVDDNELSTNVGAFTLVANADLYELYLNEADLWVNEDDEVIFTDITSTFILDAVEFDGSKVKVIDEDKKYDLDEDVIVYVDGSEVADDADEAEAELDEDKYALAKVVLNNKNDVVYIDAYELNDIVVVDEVDGDVVVRLDGEEINMKDFTIFKDGKLVELADLEENDVVLFNDDSEYAEVYNNYVTGEVEQVFAEAFEVDGTEYEYYASVVGYTYYMDGDDFEQLDREAAEKMEDTEEEVNVYLDRTGKSVFVVGDLGEPDTNTVAGVLIEDLSFDKSFNRIAGEFIFVNESGVKVTEQLIIANLDAIDGDEVDGVDETTYTVAGDKTLDVEYKTVADKTLSADAGEVVEFVYDEDGSIIELNFLRTDDFDALETDDSYTKKGVSEVANARLKSDTVVFIVDEDVTDVYALATKSISSGDVDAVKWSEIEDFDKISEGVVYISSTDRAEYIVALDKHVNRDGDTTDVVGVVDQVRTNKDGKVTQVTVWTDAGKVTYPVDSVTVTLAKGDIAVFEVEDDDQEVLDIDKFGASGTETKDFEIVSGTVDSVSTTGNRVVKLTGNAKNFELADARVYDADDMKTSTRVSDIKKGDTITLITEVKNSTSNVGFVTMAVIGKGAQTPIVVATDGTVTYINSTASVVDIDGVPYDVVDDAQTLINAFRTQLNGADIAFDINGSDEIYKITAIQATNFDVDVASMPISGITFSGNVDISANTVASNVTVNGDLVVSGTATLTATNFDVKGTTTVSSSGAVSFNSELHGNVSVTGTAGTVGFTNVEFGGNLAVAVATVTVTDSTVAGNVVGAAILVGDVTVEGTVDAAADLNGLDPANKTAIEDKQDAAVVDAATDKVVAAEDLAELNAALAADLKVASKRLALQEAIDDAQALDTEADTAVAGLPADVAPATTKADLEARMVVVQDAIDAAQAQYDVSEEAAGVALTLASGGALVNAVVVPTVAAGYTIEVKTTSDAAVYNADGEILTNGTSNVVYTVTHTVSGKTADTGVVVVTVSGL